VTSDRIPAVRPYALAKILGHNATQLGARCGSAACDLLITRFKEAVKSSDEDQYSYIWRKSIEDYEQNFRRDDVLEVLVNGLRDVLLAYCAADPSGAAETTRFLLKSEFPTLVRIGIYACTKCYPQIGSVFWDALQDTWFLEPAYWHEIYGFLNTCFRHLSGERDRLLSLIRQLKGKWREGLPTDELDERQRRNILHAIQGQGDKEVDQLYTELVRKHGPVGEHPEFQTYTGGVLVGEQSPVTTEELLVRSLDDVIDYLKSFQATGNWGEPSEDGLGRVLAEVIRRVPERFHGQLARFLECKRVYQYYVLRALQEEWNAGNDISWGEMLAFADALTTSPTFAEELKNSDQRGFRANVRWVASTIADLIHAGVRDDKRAFAPDHLDLAQKIAVRLINIVPSDTEGKATDAVAEAINTAHGHVLEATINLALRRSRLEEQAAGNHDSAWKSLSSTFGKELEQSTYELNFEFSTIVARYLPNFHYLSEAWVTQNFERIFLTEKPRVWRCAAQGFSYIGNFYPWLFKLLRSGGHLERMLEEDMKATHVHEIALQYLAIAYLQQLEDFTERGSLLAKIVSELRGGDLKHLSWFFWTFRNAGLLSDQRERVLGFWKVVSEQITGRENEYADVLSALSQLAEFIDELSPELEALWTQAATYANVNYHEPYVVENLNRLVRKYPAAVARVFRAILDRFVPDYDPQHIVSCVESLFECGENDAAEEICNIYEQRGPRDLLRPIFGKYRSKPVGPSQ